MLGSWSPRISSPPPQQPKVPRSGAVPGFASVVIPQKVTVAVSSPIPNMAQVSLSVSSIVKGLSHYNKAKVPAGENYSSENTFSVKPLTTEVIKVSSISNTPPTPRTTAAADRCVPLLIKTYVPPPTAVVERGNSPLNTRSISPSTDAVGKVTPESRNAAFQPSTVPANKVATAFEILMAATATDKRLQISSTSPYPSPTSTLAQIYSLLNKTAAIEVEKSSPALSPAPVPSPKFAVAQTSPVLKLMVENPGEKIPLLTKMTPAPSPTTAQAQVSPEKPTAATGIEKSLPVSDTVPVLFPVVEGKISSRPEMAHIDPLSLSGTEGHLKKNMTTSPVPMTSTNRASSSINQTQIPPKLGAGAKVAAQNLSSAPPPPAIAANASPVEIKPPVLPATTSVAKMASDGNMARISPSPNAVPKTTSELMAVPDIAPTAFNKNKASNRSIAPVLSAPAAVFHETSTSKPAAELPPTAFAAKVPPTRNSVPVPQSTAAVPKTNSRSKAASAIPPSTWTRNTTTRNTTPVLTSPATEPSAPSKLEAALADSQAASTAKTYPVQKPTPASQSVKTALNESKSSALAPLVSVAKASPALDTYSALKRAEKGPGSLSDSVQASQPLPLSPRKSVGNEVSQKTQAERLSANIAESFKIFKTDLESTITEVVEKKGTKVAILTVEIEDSKKLQCNTKELLKMKQKTLASMEVVIRGLRELRYGPQKLSEKEQQTSALNCEIEGLQKSLESRGEQIKIKEQGLSTLKVEIECLKKSYSSSMELEKAKDQDFARLKVEIEKVKKSQKAAENLLVVKEHQIVALRAQVEDFTGSLKTAGKMFDLESKEMLGLRAALAFKAETDELKNARAKRDLDLLDKALKRMKALELEIERLKKSLGKKDSIVRDDQEVSALKLEIERLTKSQQEKYVVGSDIARKVKAAELQRSEKDKTEHHGNLKDNKFKLAIMKTSKMQATSKTPKPGDPRKNDLMGPLIYFTNDDLRIPTYEMDFEGVSYMANEQMEIENDGPEPAIQAFTATGTGIQIHINKKISRRVVILLLLALLYSSMRKFVSYWKS